MAADYTYDLATSGKFVVVAEVNTSMPRIPGEARIHVSQCDYLVTSQMPIPELAEGRTGRLERDIGTLVAAQIPSRATLQIGIGKLPGTAIGALAGRNGIGIQSGVIGDAIMELWAKGVIDGRSKTLYPGVIVTASVLGSQRLHRWVHENPAVWLMPFSWIHRQDVLAADPAFTTVNTVLQIDLMGQVNAESIGSRQIGNAGGLASFHRAGIAAARGRGIVAVKSTTASGISTIVGSLETGDPATSLRADADVFVTEFGVTSVRGRTLAERASDLITLAHPDHRQKLTRSASTRGFLATNRPTDMLSL